MRRTREEYDWLNDPFDERKCAEEMQRARKGGGVGCLLAVLVLVIVVVVAVGGALMLGVGLLGSDLGL